MLTVRELPMAGDDASMAVEPSLSPGVFARPEDPACRRANTMWVGSVEALGRLGLQRGAETTAAQLAAVMEGRHAVNGAQVRVDGVAFDLMFLAPRSLSWVWAQGDAALRADLERAVTAAAAYSLDYLVQARPVVDNVEPARGFAAALALHAVGQPQPWTEVPTPLLHVHGYLVGVLNGSGALRGPHRLSMYEDTLTRECGAVGRAKLAGDLRGLGFGIEAGTGRGGRYFEIAGVPESLLRAGQSADKGCASLGEETDREPWDSDNF